MKKIGKNYFFLFFGLALWVLAPQYTMAAADTINVEASADRNELGLGDTLEFTVSVTSSESVEADPPRLELNDFEVLGQNQQTSSSSRLQQGPNGMEFKTQMRIDFVFMLSPKSIGTKTIPSVSLNVDGKSYQTKPLQIRVLKEGSGASRVPPQPGFPRGFPKGFEDLEEEFLNQLQRQQGGAGVIPGVPGGGGFIPQYKDVPKNPKEAFSVQLELDKTSAYEGEQIMARWMLYTRGNILSMDRVKFPDLKGFWKEILEEIPQLNFTEENINGVPYRKALLAAHALFPIKVGTAVIDEYKIRASVQTPTSQFGSFGFGPAYTYTRSSQRVEIKVKPLPTDGKPGSFSGAVGKFEASVQIAEGPVTVGQPVSLKVRIQGQGNAKLVELPSIQYPAQVEVYDTRSESKFLRDGTSFKEFEVLLIPKVEGSILIPGFEFSYFDPGQQKYVTQKIPDLTFTAGPAAAGTNSGVDSRLNAQPSPKAILKLPPIISDNSSSFFRSDIMAQPAFWIGPFAVSMLTFLIGWFLKLRQNKSSGSLIEDFNKRQKVIEKFLQEKAFEKAGIELLNLTNKTIGKIAGFKGGALELSAILEIASPELKSQFGSRLLFLNNEVQKLIFSEKSNQGMSEKYSAFNEIKSETYALLKECIKKSESELK